MIFKYRETGPLLVNCYIVGDSQTREAVVIDPGGDVDAIMFLLEEDALVCKAIINTHTHFDHIGGNAGLKAKTGAPLLVHPAEKDQLGGMNEIARQWGMDFQPSPPADRLIEEGDVLEVGSLKLAVLHTPGHSPGGISLRIVGMPMVIVGDCLFQFSIGRTDFPGASHAQLIRSIKEKIISLGDDFEVYPGHGPPTIVERERKFNPFLQDDGPGGGPGLIVAP